MKKLNKLTAALASLALVAAAFTGCVNSYPDLSPLVDLSKATVCGSMNGWIDGETLTANDDGTYYYDFTAKGSQENFCLRGDNKWGVDYRSADGSTLLSEYLMDTEMELVPFNSPDCPPLTGLTTGDNYRITVRPSGSSVFMTITHTGSNSAAFYVFDPTDGLVSVDYDGSKYSYDFTATSTTQDIIFWSEGSYYTTETDVVLGDAIDFIEEEDISAATTTFSGLTVGKTYTVTLKTEDKGKTYKISLAKKFLINCTIVSGSQFSDNSITWVLGDEAATATLEFTFDTSKTGWGSATPWALHNDGWGDKYCGGATVTAGSDFTELPNGGDNANFAGLENGKTYVLTLKADADKVYAKVIEK